MIKITAAGTMDYVMERKTRAKLLRPIAFYHNVNCGKMT